MNPHANDFVRIDAGQNMPFRVSAVSRRLSAGLHYANVNALEPPPLPAVDVLRALWAL